MVFEQSNAPQSPQSKADRSLENIPVQGAIGIKVDLLSEQVQTQTYLDMIGSIEKRYPVALANHLKTYLEQRLLREGKTALAGCKSTIDAFNIMWYRLPRGIEKWGIPASTDPERLEIAALGKDITNPKQLALIRLYAIQRGINATLRAEYIRYIAAYNPQELVTKFNELA